MLDSKKIKKLDTLYVYVAFDRKGEKILGIQAPEGNIPLIFVNRNDAIDDNVRTVIKGMIDPVSRIKLVEFREAKILETM